MRMHVKTGPELVVLALAAGVLLPQSALAQSSQAGWDTGKWRFGASIYAYLPTISGSLAVPFDTGGPSINVDADTILDNLKFTVMGSFDMHNGRWGFFTDVLYLDVGGSKSETRDFSVGNVGLPGSATADVSLDLKGLVWTLAGEYRVVADKAWTMDVLGGARMFGIKPTVGYSINGNIGSLPLPGRSGSTQASPTNWDGIVGVKGRYTFGQRHEWNVPYYLDVGTGESDLTFQAMLGIGYSFQWGDVVAAWRYLDYDFKSDSPIKDMSFNGPMFGVLFKW